MMPLYKGNGGKWDGNNCQGISIIPSLQSYISVWPYIATQSAKRDYIEKHPLEYSICLLTCAMHVQTANAINLQSMDLQTT